MLNKKKENEGDKMNNMFSSVYLERRICWMEFLPR